jgi:Flp pilus assembly protein TadD
MDRLAAYWNSAQEACRAGDLPQAIASLREVVRLAPEIAEAHNELGNLLSATGQWDGAIAAFEQVKRLQPNRPEGYFNLANVRRAAGDLAGAEVAYRQALNVAPSLAPALNNLGTLRQSQGDLAEAERCFREAIRAAPEQSEAHLNLGVILESRRQFDEAERCYRRAVELRPDDASAHNNLGTLFLSQRRWNEAGAAFRAALAADPHAARPHCNLGVIALGMGQFSEARSHFTRSLTLDPELVQSHYNLGMLLVAHGEFDEGWRHYAWYSRCGAVAGRTFDQPVWDGSPLAGRTILVHGDHGLGDTIHFIRYLGEIRRRGAGHVLLDPQPRLRPLLAGSGFGEYLTPEKSLPPFDVHITLLGLPGALAIDKLPLGEGVPYLRARDELVEQWRAPVARIEGFRVGIAWHGSRKLAGPDWRSIPLAAFKPLADVPGVRLVSLQQGDSRPETVASAEQLRVVDLGAGVDSESGAFMDTAAIIRHLDLVITCDTALAHVAGALGAPVWVALPAAPDWRWLLNRADSPWYPSMRLFRQDTLDDWSAPFARMAAELTLRVRAGDD